MIRPTSTRLAVALGAGVLLVATAAPGRAQLSMGPLLTVGDDSGFGFGARTDFDLAGPMSLDDSYFRDLFGSVTATYSFMGCGSGPDCSTMEVGGNANLPLTARSASLTAYAGAGVHIAASFVSGHQEERDDVGERGDRGAAAPMQRSHPRDDERESDVSVGPNLIGGLRFDALGVDWFLEGKLAFSRSGQFALSTGFLFW
ncbi:MAG: hypothetical protein OXE96_12885 [Gemmatimonadetes bacterium]|nr:hypothetical protein [Gemmatimonadota bacterium]